MYLGLFGESLDHLPVAKGLRYRLAYIVQVFFVVLHSAFLEGVELHLAPKIAVGNRVLQENLKHSGRKSEGPKNTHHTVLPWSLSDLERTLTYFAQVTLPSSSNVLEIETYCSLWYPDG